MPVAEKLYAERDIFDQGEHFTRHMTALTAEGLHAKTDIAAELAHRDIEVERLTGTVRQLKEAIYWALGERDAFPEEPPPLAGKYRRRYHWRSELRRRSGLPIGGRPAESVPEVRCICGWQGPATVVEDTKACPACGAAFQTVGA